MFPQLVLRIIADYGTSAKSQDFHLDGVREGKWRVCGAANTSGTHVWCYRTEASHDGWYHVWCVVDLTDPDLKLKQRYYYECRDDSNLSAAVCPFTGYLLHRRTMCADFVVGDEDEIIPCNISVDVHMSLLALYDDQGPPRWVMPTPENNGAKYIMTHMLNLATCYKAPILDPVTVFFIDPETKTEVRTLFDQALLVQTMEDSKIVTLLLAGDDDGVRHITRIIVSNDMNWMAVQYFIKDTSSPIRAHFFFYSLFYRFSHEEYRLIWKERQPTRLSRMIGFSPDSSCFFYQVRAGDIVRVHLQNSPLVMLRISTTKS